MAENDKRKQDIGAKLMEHRRALYSYIYACVRDEHATEDILQDVAQVALTSVEKLRDPSLAANWLFGIARRQVLEDSRKSKRRQSLPPDVIEMMAAQAERTKPQHILDRKQYLMECIEELPEDHRGIIMRRYDGTTKNSQQLAEQLGRTVQAVYGLVKRIRVQLARCVERKIKAAETEE